MTINTEKQDRKLFDNDKKNKIIYLNKSESLQNLVISRESQLMYRLTISQTDFI